METPKHIHINSGRQIGAGGLQLAQKLSEDLGIKLFDKELITLAAKESGFKSSLFEKADEKNNLGLNNSFSLSAFVEAIPTGFGANFMNSGRLFEIQSQVIRKIASEGSTIILGRCADYILRDYPNCFNIFISANMEDRIARMRKAKKISDIDKLSDEKVASLLTKGDKKRASYYSEYSFKTWGAASSYDMCISSSKYTIDEIASIIEAYIEKH